MDDQPEGSLTAALIAIQAALPPVGKTEEAQAGNRTYRYADLAAIHAAVLPVLAAHGLAWTTRPTLVGELFVLDYELRHIAGTMITGRYPLPSPAASSQALGSAITYARRYALCAVLGITPAGDDDDGAEAAAATIGSAWRPPANPSTRKAERHRADRKGPLPDDQWTTPPYEGTDAEKIPGSSTPDQHRRIGMLFGKLGCTDRADRLATSMSILNLPELVTSKNLSWAQADDLCRHLEKEIAHAGAPAAEVR